MTVHDLNEHRSAAQWRKANAIRHAMIDLATEGMRAATNDPHATLGAAHLRDLADAAWLGRDRTEMWANYAELAGVNRPGSSSGDPTEVIAKVCAGLRADADALDADDGDPVLIAQLAASIAAARAG